MAPVDQRAQRLLARKRVAAAAGEHAEALVEPLAQLLQAEHLDARRRQLDRERNAVQAPADVGDDRRVFVGQRKALVGRLRAIDEERDRRVPSRVGRGKFRVDLAAGRRATACGTSPRRRSRALGGSTRAL